MRQRAGLALGSYEMMSSATNSAIRDGRACGRGSVLLLRKTRMCEPVCGRAEVVMSLGCGNGLGVWGFWMRAGVLIGGAEEEGKESVSAVWLMMRARRRGGGMVRLVVVEGKWLSSGNGMRAGRFIRWVVSPVATIDPGYICTSIFFPDECLLACLRGKGLSEKYDGIRYFWPRRMEWNE